MESAVEPALLGLVLDSSVLIAAERRNRPAAQVIEDVVEKIGAVPGHGIYCANKLPKPQPKSLERFKLGRAEISRARQAPATAAPTIVRWRPTI